MFALLNNDRGNDAAASHSEQGNEHPNAVVVSHSENGRNNTLEIDGEMGQIAATGELHCLATVRELAERRGVSNPESVLAQIEEAEADNLSDAERLAWFDLISKTGDREAVLIACEYLWSEPITEENAERRNEAFGDACIGYIDRERQGALDINHAYQSDVLKLLNRPYKDLAVVERVMLQREIGSIDARRKYYPQLFFGKWMPFEAN